MTGPATVLRRAPIATRRGWDTVADLVHRAAAETSADAAAHLLRPLFEEIDWLGDLASMEMDAMRGDALALPSFPATRAGASASLILAARPPVTLLLTRIDAAPDGRPASPKSMSVRFSGMLCLTRLLGTHDAGALLAYARPDGSHCRSRPISLSPGKLVVLDERRTALCLTPASRSLLLLRARIGRAEAPAARRFDLGTGALRGTVQGDGGFARMTMLLSLLRAAGAEQAVPAMIALLDRPDGRERWTVMGELLALDATAAWPYLETMAAGDSDPQLRAAAGLVLDRHAAMAA